MILNFSRDQIVAFHQDGLLKGNGPLWFDVCKALKEGKTQEKVAELFNLTDDSHVRKIRNKHCPECK